MLVVVVLVVVVLVMVVVLIVVLFLVVLFMVVFSCGCGNGSSGGCDGSNRSSSIYTVMFHYLAQYFFSFHFRTLPTSVVIPEG
jgi:hypothetical protein